MSTHWEESIIKGKKKSQAVWSLCVCSSKVKRSFNTHYTSITPWHKDSMLIFQKIKNPLTSLEIIQDH
ncbi:hypothetical protein CICLE_v10027098mg [Citrus x clementina]|uniref:Uncharacterized protein n=1 Tax=Citrus clementina TaxID=85681 RepID=V4SLV3_CITCL|nr:hypothetical protein CICLE_v10027098mg [Citrus x clementina]